MAEQIYQESSYRFTDPIRFFKANDPYYFEVDNIPLKQLQENCNWLKDQVRLATETRITDIKRPDIDELRPYASGGDRVVRVLPGRYTARINDASEKTPLAYLNRVMGTAIGDVDAWDSALPNPGDFPNGRNATLQAALNQFKSLLSQDALGMTGLAERAFTWPVVSPYSPVNSTGVQVNQGSNTLGYAGADANITGGGADFSPMVITQALLWAKSLGSSAPSTVLPSFEITNPNSGFAKFPRTESYFIKRWRGVSRLAIVDIPSELTIEVPTFDPDDFSYTNTDGTQTPVAGVQSRVDMIFIYSKPVDMSGVNILKTSGKQKITTPQLGIVKGAGIRANFQETGNFSKDYIETTGDTPSILASPGDQNNTNMGFTAASGNDIEYSIRGSFPAPDDILNLAPLISERLEENAYELVGQSIMPVAYVWVQNGSALVANNDIVDIRPFFRTAELAYNERAGVAAAFPQLSLANPAVGKGQLDYEVRRMYEELEPRLHNLEAGGNSLSQNNAMSLATGYVFGGYNFGPEGALYNFYEGTLGSDPAALRSYIRSTYAYASESAPVQIPAYPDWDLSQWCIEQDLENKGLYPNDRINTFFGDNIRSNAGSNSELTLTDGTNEAGNDPTKLFGFVNTFNTMGFEVSFHYISKKIKFQRPTWLADYSVDVDFLNCLPQTFRGATAAGNNPASYTGHWVQKGWDEFTIYVAFAAIPTTGLAPATFASFPAPYQTTIVTSSTKKKKTTASVTVAARDGGRFSSFVVPVSDILTSNTDPYSTVAGAGYRGNPRMGLCTYPTIMWNFKGVPINDAGFHYGNLNDTNPTITLRSS
jgi:hypothetical protein